MAKTKQPKNTGKKTPLSQKELEQHVGGLSPLTPPATLITSMDGFKKLPPKGKRAKPQQRLAAAIAAGKTSPVTPKNPTPKPIGGLITSTKKIR